MAPLFSIVMPVYNTERYVKKALDSVLQQKFKDFEFVIIDDGSTDSCPQILDEYAAKDSRVKVTHIPNGGAFPA